MTPQKILSVVEKYRKYLNESGSKPKRINIEKTFGECTRSELLSHAQYLVENFKNIDIETQYDKANRHLAAIQMCLSFAMVYSLAELMEHNRPD